MGGHDMTVLMAA
jgi:translation initiation factor 3 subunit E